MQLTKSRLNHGASFGSQSAAYETETVVHSVPVFTSFGLVALGKPAILMADAIDDSPGFFGERLEAFRTSLVVKIRKNTSSLVPTATESDVLGAALFVLTAASVVLFNKDKKVTWSAP